MQITTAAQATQRDLNAIASGIDSWSLMYAAGSVAAQSIAEIATMAAASAVFVYAGVGNNGGDAYVVAAELLGNDFVVVLTEAGEPRTDNGRRARELYRSARDSAAEHTDPDTDSDSVRFVLVDGLLGTGQTGELRERERELASRIAAFHTDGHIVVALDVPTGVNATTGVVAEDAVRADYTLSFGTMKRAHVLQREQCGQVVVLDIGLGDFADIEDGAWELADPHNVSGFVPKIKWNAHKGTRGRLAIIGGSEGMAGAVVLSSEAALRSGVGLVHAHVHQASALPMQLAVPQAITHVLGESHSRESLNTMHAIAIGPGFGRSEKSMRMLNELIASLPNVPIVLDADALTLLGGNAQTLRSLCEHRDVVYTPHVGEFAQLLGHAPAETLNGRVQQAHELADQTRATILLKGAPTIVVTHGETSVTVIARGTAVLATGGSGDMLTGIVGTLLAQGVPGQDAAAVAAFVHGRAAEIATERAGTVRGLTLHDVLNALAPAWREVSDEQSASSAQSPMVLAQLPAVV